MYMYIYIYIYIYIIELASGSSACPSLPARKATDEQVWKRRHKQRH